MPFVQRIVSPTNLFSTPIEQQQPQPLVVINEEIDETDRNKHVVVQYVNLVRQIADLAKHSENIIMQIFNDSLNINQRWQRLERRLDVLRTNVDGLNASAGEITSAGNIGRFIEVEKHFSSTVTKNKNNNKENGVDDDGGITETNRLFVVDTRPGHLRNLCQSSSTNKKRRRPRSDLIGFEDGSTQTDVHFRQRCNGNVEQETTPKLMSTTFQADSKHSSSSSTTAASVSTNSFLSADEISLREENTSNEKKFVDDYYSKNSSSKSFVVTVPVDISGSALRRMSSLRNHTKKSTTFDDFRTTTNDIVTEENFSDDRKIDAAPRKLHRCSRRNTIAVVDLKNVDDKTTTVAVSSSSTSNFADYSTSSPTTTTMADEYFYDFAPFYRRRTKRSSLLSSVNQFFSLRRPKKKDSKLPKITTSATLDDFRKSTTTTRNNFSCSSPTMMEFTHLSTLRSPLSRRRRCETSETTTTTNGNGFKQFFKRTLSLHLSSTRKSKNNHNNSDYLYDSLPFRRQSAKKSAVEQTNGYCNSSAEIITDVRPVKSSDSTTTNRFSRNYSGRPKSNLPITVESQVFNVATVLRNNQQPPPKSIGTIATTKSVKIPSPSSSRDSAYSSCGKKVRPLSIVSFGSIASLDLTEKNAHNGWYRQGYQLEYPDECLNNGNVGGVKQPPEANSCGDVKISSPRLIVSTLPSDIVFERKSSSRSPPYSDISSMNDSNYSCDQEGYFTSMHRDSGLLHDAHRPKSKSSATGSKSVATNDFRGRSFSTHSSTSTVAVEPSDASDVFVDSSNESTSSTSFLLKDKIADVSARRAFPPLCDVSLSESSDNDTLKKQTRRRLQKITSPPPPPCVTTTADRIDAFDLWLLSKFQAEMTLKQNQSTGCYVNTNGWRYTTTNGHSLPRHVKKEPNNNDIIDKYISDERKTVGDTCNNYNNHTVPRKSVRFRE